MGILYATPARGQDVLSFEYDGEWLASAQARALDPALRLLAGPQYGKPSFGVLLDSSPDRWGRVLMDRREALVARKARRQPRRLTELDYLLGVYDGHRLGALRYRREGGRYLDDNAALSSPPDRAGPVARRSPTEGQRDRREGAPVDREVPRRT